MLLRSISLLSAALLGACAASPSTPTPPPAPARMLAHALPAATNATYAFSDSSAFDIQGGAIGDIRVNIGAAGTANVAFAQKPSAVEATVRVTDFAGSLTNTASGGGPTATEADIEGPAVLQVSPRGETKVTTMPKLSAVVQRVGLGESFFRRFFVRLPAREVRAGANWVDTVSTTDDNSGTKISVRDVITATFVKDSLVAGRTYALITTTTQRTLTVAGVSDGVEIAQSLTGTGTGSILWDTERLILAERSETSQLKGTFDLPQMGITGLPIVARASGKIVLR